MTRNCNILMATQRTTKQVNYSLELSLTNNVISNLNPNWFVKTDYII